MPRRMRPPVHHNLKVEEGTVVIGSDKVEHDWLEPGMNVVALPEEQCAFIHEDLATDRSMDGTIQTIWRVRAIKEGRMWVNLVGYAPDIIFCGGCFRPVERKELS